MPTLFDCVGDGDVDALTALLATGLTVEGVDDDGNSALHKAAEGEEACMKLLLAAPGAEAALKLKNAAGDTALMSAIRYEDANLVQLMLPSSPATDEAIALAKELSLTVIVALLTGEAVPEAPAETEGKEKVERRNSVSGEDLDDFSKVSVAENKK